MAPTPIDFYFYITPSTINTITIVSTLSGEEETVGKTNGYFLLSGADIDQTFTISADGYQNATYSYTTVQSPDIYITMTPDVVYVSKLSDGTNTYYIKDSNALNSSDIVSSMDSSSSNSKAVGAKLFYDTCGDIETLINAL